MIIEIMFPKYQKKIYQRGYIYQLSGGSNMVKVDLITGFLGAGKTTFIHKYLHYLKKKGETIHLIENEFGSTSVDSDFLKEEADETCQISDLAGMCMCCIGKSAFIQMLIDSSKEGCDRIIVEPSGIYDVDEFFDVLSDVRVRELCEIGTIITIVDPFSRERFTSEAAYLMFSQLVSSGTVVFSKTQLTTDEEIENTKEWIDNLLRDKGCENGIMAEYCTKPWDELTDDDFEELEEAYYYRVVYDREEFQHSAIFQSEEISVSVQDKKELEAIVKKLFTSEKYGNVFRVKGYAMTEKDGCFEVNCTGEFMSCIPVHTDKNKLVVIGQQLKYKMFHPFVIESK